MTPLPKSAVEIISKSKGLTVTDWTIRESGKEDEEDSGWRFQAILQNVSSGVFKGLEAELRYFDSSGQFLGVDEWFTILEELESQGDKTVNISLNVPLGTSRAVFHAKGNRSNFFEKHSFLLFAVLLLISCVLLFLKK